MYAYAVNLDSRSFVQSFYRKDVVLRVLLCPLELHSRQTKSLRHHRNDELSHAHGKAVPMINTIENETY